MAIMAVKLVCDVLFWYFFHEEINTKITQKKSCLETLLLSHNFRVGGDTNDDALQGLLRLFLNFFHYQIFNYTWMYMRQVYKSQKNTFALRPSIAFNKPSSKTRSKIGALCINTCQNTFSMNGTSWEILLILWSYLVTQGA